MATISEEIIQIGKITDRIGTYKRTLKVNLNIEHHSNCSHNSRVPLIRIEFHLVF